MLRFIISFSTISGFENSKILGIYGLNSTLPSILNGSPLITFFANSEASYYL